MKKTVLILGIIIGLHLNYLAIKKITYYLDLYLSQFKALPYQNLPPKEVLRLKRYHGAWFVFWDEKAKCWFFIRQGHRIKLTNGVKLKLS